MVANTGIGLLGWKASRHLVNSPSISEGVMWTFEFGCWLPTFSEKSINGSQVVSHFLFLWCALFFHEQHVLDLRELAGARFVQTGCPWWQIMHRGGERAWKFRYVRMAILQPARLEEHPGCGDGDSTVVPWTGTGAEARLCCAGSGVWLGHGGTVELRRGCRRPGAELMWGACCSKWGLSALAGVEMASGMGSSLLEVPYVIGEGQLWLQGRRRAMSSLSSLRKLS